MFADGRHEHEWVVLAAVKHIQRDDCTMPGKFIQLYCSYTPSVQEPSLAVDKISPVPRVRVIFYLLSQLLDN